LCYNQFIKYMKTKKQKSIIYARVSSREQEETGYSLPSQKKLLKEYAEKNNFNVVKIFSISESANGKYQRKTFEEMLNYTKKNNVNIIICEKVDRLTRNMRDAVSVNDWIKDDIKKQVHFVKENCILNKNSKSNEKFIWNIKVSVAQYYIDNLSEEVKKGQKEKISQGWLPTSPPIGYITIGEKGHKTHIIDEKKAPFILELFELYASGNYSIKKLTEVMQTKGLLNKYNRKISKSQMHLLLSNPFYIGKIVWNGETSEGLQEKIISEELFNEVQKKLARGTKSPQYRKHLPTFKAKIHCEECNGTITWETQKGNWYGHCNHHKKCSQKKYIRQEKVEKQLFPYFDKIAPQNEEVLKWVQEVLKEDHGKEKKEIKIKRTVLNQNFSRVQNRLEKLYDDKLDSVIDIDFYNKKSSEYEAEKKSISKELKTLDEDNTNYLNAGISIHELACKSKDIYLNKKTTIEDKRMLLSYIFSNITLNDSKVTPNYTFAFDFLSKHIPVANSAFQNFEPSETNVKMPLNTKSVIIKDELCIKLREQDSNLRHLD
jgi:site-specific DNA recombinase